MLWYPCLPASQASETLPGGPPSRMDSVEGSSADPCLQDASAMPRVTPTRGGLRRSCWRRRRGLRPSFADRRASAKRGAPKKSTGVMASEEELQLQSPSKAQEKSSNMEVGSEEEPKECEEAEEEGVWEEEKEREEEEAVEDEGEEEEEEAEEEGEAEEEEDKVQSSKKEEDPKGESGLIGARKRKSNKVMKREVEPRSESTEEEGKPEEVRYVCPICEDVLSSQHLFTVHIRSHNAAESSSGGGSPGGSKAFSCRICGKALSSSSSLDRHMLVHSGERPFKCKLCGVAFTTNGNMHRHMRTHATATSKEAEEVSDGGSSDSGGSKRGKTPGRKRQVEGVKGRRKGKEGGWRCLTCDLSFTNHRELRLHAYMTHREMEAEEEDDDEEIEEEERGRKRSRRAEGTPTLGFRDLTFVDFSTSKFPLIAKAACEKSVHRASSEFHRFHCGRCDRAFPCGSALHIHADSLHGSNSPAAPSADPKEDFFAVLNLQNKTRCCSSPPQALKMLRQNSPSLSHLPPAERKRREEEFDNAFYFNATKEARLAEENGGEASEAPKDLADISSIISAVAGNASGLMRSVEDEEGSEEEEEEQEEEDATFAAELREMKSRGEFPCKLCPSVFPNLRALKGHGRYHVAEVGEGEGEEERHPCCLCGRRVAKHALARHLRSHNGERPFRCALCRYAFTTKANCERHLRNRHSKVSREEVRRSVIYSPVGEEQADGEMETKPHETHIPSKLSTLLSVISDPKHGLESLGKPTIRTEEKSKISDEEEDLHSKSRVDDLSSVEALVNFAKSPSLPLSMISSQIALQQNVFRPIPIKREGGNESEGTDAPLDLSMDALDLSNKKTQDEPEDLSKSNCGKNRSAGVAFDGSTLVPPRIPSVTRTLTVPPENPLISMMPKMDSTPTALSNGSAPVDGARPPSASFYPGPLHMYLNHQFPISAPSRPSMSNFPYLLPLPFPGSSPTLVPQLPGAHSPLRSQSLMSPPSTQSIPSHTPMPPFPRQGTPNSITPPNLECLEKEILRKLQLSSGGSLVLEQASISDRIQAFAMAAVASGFPSQATTSEHPPQSMASQAKDMKPNDQPVIPMGESTPTKDDPRMQPGVKMVIKNGVLMPKQKQRRYRTERPFACCHCSARFTLRSNMERHIKQQHPEFWSQRPRGGRRGGSTGLTAPSRSDASPSRDGRLSNSPDGPLPPAASLPAESAGKPSSEDGGSDYNEDTNMDESENNNTDSVTEDRMSICESSNNVDDANDKAKDSNKTVISEEVKNAIAQQLKSKLIADCRSAFSPSVRSDDAKVINAKEEARKGAKNSKEESNADDEENSGELVIDEEKVDMETDCNGDRRGNSITKEDESSGVDLASVSKLLDNASTQTFQQYFKSEEDDEADERRRGGEGRGGDEGYEGGADGEDEEEEEGWKSGDESGGSKGASSGEEERAEREDSLERKLASVTVEAATAADTEDKGKRRSAYSSAPNRVSCPYCMRKFPWRSSLRRHILTHTGQKPYKCAHCPLLFTTKSNCDRHLLRKHGKGSGGSSSGTEDAVSVLNSSGSGAVSPGGAYAMRNVPERPYKCSVCPSSTFSTQNNLKKHLATKHQHLQVPNNGRCSTSPKGGSEKAGSVSSAGSPRCATEEKDMDDEEDEEGLVGAEDEEGMLEEEDEGEEGSGVEGERVVKKKKNGSEEINEVPRRDQVNGEEHGKSKEHQNNHNHQVTPHQHLHHQHHHHHPGSDLPFKCHLCERSYAERNDALNHIRDSHTSEYELLVAKGALDSAAAVTSEDPHNNNNHGSVYHNNNNISGLEQGGEENLEQLRGKFPDYANRKVVCAFCMRRFWSAEDLRRHMRTHTGERPFSCDICARRFTLKHSMLRHRKKHSSSERASLGNPMAAATSEASGDEEASTNKHREAPNTNWQKEEDDKDSKRRKLCPQEIGLKSTIRGGAAALGSATGDLIGNLLGIQDGSIIDKMLLSKSANDAAKLLGVEGHD